MALSTLLALLTVQQLAHAGIRADTVPTRAGAVARASRATTPPRIDGRLDDEAWRGAAPLGQFTQRDPVWGGPATEPTEARVLFTDDALYIGVRAFDTRPAEIIGQLTRRDVLSASDWITVAVDVQHDRRTAYVFAVNAAGVQRDVFRFNDVEEDDTWNAVWESAVWSDSLGWSAELRIPFSQLRMPGGRQHRFGFNVSRRLSRTGEWVSWRAPAIGQAGIVSAYGDLEGIDGVRGVRPLEVTPYLLAGAGRPAPDPGNPFANLEPTHAIGADLRAGLPGNLTLTAAFNPDFGQVEADPAVVNLSALETFLPERRPFFAEGADLFRLSMAHASWSTEGLFYSRRVGRAPQLDAATRGGWAEDPATTTILGAGKVTGRIAPGWTLGLLAALTAEERAEVRDSAGAPHADLVEPRTLYAVGRLARELRGGQTVLGLFGTAVSRDLPGDVTSLRSGAATLGVSWEHRFLGDRWHFIGQLIGSRVQGSQDAITRTQRSSVRFFQRPDDGIALDSARTSLSGHGGIVEVARRAGEWIGGVRMAWRSPGFEVNDAGFQTWASQRFGRAHVTRRWLSPSRMFNRVEVTGALAANYTWNGHRVMGTSELTGLFLTRGNWLLRSSLWYRFGGRDPFVLRGGPALAMPENWYAEQGIETDGRRRVWFSLYAGAWNYPTSEWQGWWTVGRATWRPSNGVELSLSPRLDTWLDSRGWLRSAQYAGETIYLLGQRRVMVAAAGLRANATMSPRLSIEAFAEPFLSRGQFQSFKRVADSHAGTEAGRFTAIAEDQVIRSGDAVAVDFDRDGTGDVDLGEPDFTRVSLRTNLVLRWEYRPASTLFVVWQHGREEESPRALAAGDGLSRLGTLGAANTLLVKMSYWFRIR